MLAYAATSASCNATVTMAVELVQAEESNKPLYGSNRIRRSHAGAFYILFRNEEVARWISAAGKMLACSDTLQSNRKPACRKLLIWQHSEHDHCMRAGRHV